MAKVITKTALVDGDLLLYRFGHRGQEVYKWDEDTTSTVVQDAGAVISEMEEFLDELLRKVKCKRYRLCLSGPDPFRYQILQSYKHNRQGVAKPVLYPVLKQTLIDWNALLKPGLEADDLLGIIATRGKDGEYIMCSIDKDLEQIPGWHFNWNKDATPRYVGRREADLKFYTQCLTGDPTDGFSGCPGIGPKKAAKILQAAVGEAHWETEIWKAIVVAYSAAELTEAYALTQARVARICRAEDYDFTRNKPIWWTPTNTT